MEKWRDIKNFESLYQVSNKGNVRVKERFVKNSRNPSMKTRRNSKAMSLINNGNGYIYVTLTKDGRRYNKYVHRLVAEAFIDNPKRLNEIDHINRNRADNRVENLRWVTHYENINCSGAVGRRNKRKPTNTGIEYITFTKGRYCFQLQRKEMCIYKRFKTLEEAKAYKDSLKGVIL